MKLQGYSQLTQLSQGGMATVYKGLQDSLNRVVAIKFLSDSFIGHNKAQKLFDQESLIIAQLNHPNIIHVIDRGISSDGEPYFVMEYIEGTDLEQAITKGHLSFNVKVDLMMQVCKGMAYAHKNGIIHRDIKPANILIDEEETAHILDFGIAQLAQSDGDPSHASKDVIGTVNYMSPEQIKAPETVTFSTDLYSLGVVMFELFTNKLPNKTRLTPSQLNPNIPPELDKLITQCLEEDPDNRPVSSTLIRDELLKILRGAHLNATQISEASQDVGSVGHKFVLLDVLRKDEWGAVYLFEEKVEHGLIVIKKRLRSNDGYQQARLLTTFKHKNIVNILGTSRNERAFIVVMENLGGGSLKDRLIKPYAFEDFYPIALQLCDALRYAHENQIFHGNLRPSSVMFNDEDQLKLTDFGFSESTALNQIQKDAYLPPESEVCTLKGDIYSAGAIFYHMLTGYTIHYQDGHINFNANFLNLDGKLQSLLKGMLSKVPGLRYKNFEEVLLAFSQLSAATQFHGTNKTVILDNIHNAEKTVWQKVTTLKITPFILLFFVLNLTFFSVFFYFNPAIFEQFIQSLISVYHWFLDLF